MFGQRGKDTRASNSAATILGGNDLADGADSISGSFGADFLFGNGGADTIAAKDGNNTVVAGFGADSVVTSSDSDLIFGNESNDTIRDTGGQNTLFVTGAFEHGSGHKLAKERQPLCGQLANEGRMDRGTMQPLTLPRWLGWAVRDCGEINEETPER